MKTFVGLFLISVSAFAQSSDYKGSFAATQSSGAPCDLVFQYPNYNVKHFATGPTKLTSVLNFQSWGGAGFFHNLSFIGNLGGSGDFENKKTITVGKYRYDLKAEGIVDENVVVAEVSVKASEKNVEICTASGEYSGFAQ